MSKNFPYLGYLEPIGFESRKTKIQEILEDLENRISALETKELTNKLESMVEGEELEMTLPGNVVVDTKPLTIKAKTIVTMDLNDNDIVATKPSVDTLIIEDGATLTINGNGLVESAEGGDGYPLIANGNVSINGGHFISKFDANGLANACIYARGNGKIEIYGGRFEGHDGSFVLNKKDGDRATTSILVYGGEFVEFDPSNNASEGPNTNFVADGYKVEHFTENGKNIYRVVKA